MCKRRPCIAKLSGVSSAIEILRKTEWQKAICYLAGSGPHQYSRPSYVQRSTMLATRACNASLNIAFSDCNSFNSSSRIRLLIRASLVSLRMCARRMACWITIIAIHLYLRRSCQHELCYMKFFLRCRDIPDLQPVIQQWGRVPQTP